MGMKRESKVDTGQECCCNQTREKRQNERIDEAKTSVWHVECEVTALQQRCDNQQTVKIINVVLREKVIWVKVQDSTYHIYNI